MKKIKPSNIFDFYSPPGNSMKIADFGISNSVIEAPITAIASPIGQELPKVNKSDNTWLYILAGAVIIIGGICYIKYKNKKEKEDIQAKNRTNINHNI